MRSALLLLSLVAASCGGARETLPAPGVPLVSIPVGGAVARAEIAATPEARERGLMFRDALPPDQGMLFVYPEDRPLGFWMKNCRSPLSAAFLDREGRILNIEEMAPGAGVPDGELRRYHSRGGARFVLELESGWFARNGVRPGDRADLPAALRGVAVR